MTARQYNKIREQIRNSGLTFDEDCFHDTLLSGLQHKVDFLTEYRRITRKEYHRRMDTVCVEELFFDWIQADDGEESVRRNGEAERLARFCKSMLSDTDLLLLRLHFRDGLEYRTISRYLGLTDNGAWQRLNYLFKRIKRMYKPKYQLTKNRNS